MQNKKELDRDDKLQSYLDCQTFVRKMLGNSNSGETTCEILINNSFTTNNLEITLVEHIPAYYFSCDLFYSFGIKNPIWSNYIKFKWDNLEKELTASYEDKKISFLTT